MVRIVNGNFHQGQIVSNAAGFQCTAIALAVIFLISSGRVPNPAVWDANVVDTVLSVGHSFYEQIITASRDHTPRYLGHWELPPYVEFDNEIINFLYYTDIFHGVNLPLDSEPYSMTASDGSVSVHDAIQQGSAISDSLLLTVGSSTISIFRLNNEWYLFDSHGRDSNGHSSSTGTASLSAFNNIDDLTAFINTNFGSFQFNLTPVIINDQPNLMHRNQSLQNLHLNTNACPLDTICDESNMNNSNSYNQRSTSDKVASASHDYYQSNQTNAPNGYSAIFLDKQMSFYVKNNSPFNLQSTIYNTNSTTVPSSVSETTYNQQHNQYLNTTDLSDLCNKHFTCNHKSGQHLKRSKKCPCQIYENKIRETLSHFCICCEKILFPDQVKYFSPPEMINPFQTNNFPNCSLVFEPNSSFCNPCVSALSKKKIPPTCKYNNMFAGIVPECLKILDLAEKRMIAQIQTFMTILILPGGQFAEKGLAIHFPLDLNNYFQQLLNIQDEHFLILNQGKDHVQSMSFRNVANYDLVKLAIQWLKQHNHLYQNFPQLTYSNTDIHSNLSENLTESIQNSNLKEVFQNVSQCSVIPIDFVLPEVDMQKFIGSGKKISLPTLYNEPTWLSHIPHGEELAFPTLFPLGIGGINQDRTFPINVQKYYLMRLYNKDDRWRTDLPYLMYAVNHMEQAKLGNEIEIQMRLRRGSSLTAGNLVSADHSSEVRSNSFMFMKKIRGTAAYWLNVLHDLLAMVKCIGPPTLFVTLSADDCHWPELDMLLTGRTYSDCVNSPSGTSNMIKNPLLTSLHFERRWKSLFKDVIKGPKPPFGHVIDHFARIEYQNRGSPHMHIFLWIDKAPNLLSNSSNDIIEFIDSIIKSTIPSEDEDKELHDLVSRLQIHHHTTTCQKRRYSSCRFGFPRPATSKTHLLQNVNSTNPSNRGRFYETMRTENDMYVNPYNDVILRRWRANMDIQMVSTSHGLAYYVCTYIPKAEPDDLKEALSKVFNNISSQPQAYSLKKQMYLIGNCVLKSRRLSAQEAAARIGNLQLIWRSREVVYLNTRPLNQRFKILKPKHERDALPDNSTDIFSTNVLDYYMDRPTDLENLSLFKFASTYKPSQSKTVNVSMRSLPRIKLRKLDKIMQQRQHSAVIRTPNFKADSDEYFFSVLMLHLPYRNESHLLGSYQTAKDAFINKHQYIDLSGIQYSSYLHDIEKIVRILRTTNEDLGAIVAPNTDEGNMCNDNIADDFRLFSNTSIPSHEGNTTLNYPTNYTVEDNIHNLQVNLLSEEQISQQVAHLNSDQQVIFDMIQTHFLSHCNSPLHIFVSGEGGTGKSFLIKTIVEWLRCYTASFSGANPVLVCGPTGMSAKNINGKTLHSAFKLPVQHGREPEYKELSSRVLQQIRNQFQSVHTLIIDEISMVSSSMLTYIHRRLCAIKGSSQFFGGLNVIVIGDFFQLKPIRGRFAFTNTLLWHLFDSYILTTNVRQSNDVAYSQILSRIRHGQTLMSDIHILMSRIITNDHPDFIGALRVFPTVREVTDFNKAKQVLLENECVHHEAVHEFHSSDVGTNYIIDEYIPVDDRDAGGLPRILSLSVGTRVMLIRNIATDQGLVNGALGFVTGMTFENDRLTHIYVQFDDESIGQMFYNAEHNAIGIETISQEFYSKGRSLYRTQFPLLPAWACTIHKVQGISTDKIVVSLGKSVFADGQFYVALSRVRTLQGLGILALDPTKIKANKEVLTFYETLSLICKHIHN